MAKLTPIQIDDSTIIYIEVNEDVEETEIPVATIVEESEEEEEALTDKGMSPEDLRKKMVQNFQVIQNTIRAYTVCSLNSFKQLPINNVNKVTLEFGIELGGEAGIPYVTKGTAKSNLKITVECLFPENKPQLK